MSTTLKQKFLGGVAWVALSRGVMAGIGALVTIILARLLVPEDYGVVTMAMVFIGVAQQARDFGVGQALIQLEDVDSESEKTAFTYALLSATALYGLLFVIAGPIATFFGDDRVKEVVRIMGLSFPMASFGVVPSALLRRNLTLRGEATANTLSVILEAVVTVALASMRYGYWSLVVGKLVGVAATSVFLSLASPWHVGFRLRTAHAGRIFRFGGGVTLSSVLWYAYTNADFLIIGRVLGGNALGVYTMAWNVAKMPWDKLWVSISPLVLPLFARAREEPGAIGRILLRVTRHIGVIMFPAVAGLGAIAPEFSSVVLGEKWLGVTTPLAMFCVLGLVRGVAVLWGPVLLSTGHVSDTVRFNLLCVVVLPIGFWIGTAMGIDGVSIAWAVLYPTVAFAALLPQTLRVAGVRLGPYITSLIDPLLASLGMVAAVSFVRWIVPFSGILLLVTLMFTGVVVYYAIVRLRMGPVSDSVRAFLRDTKAGITS